MADISKYGEKSNSEITTNESETENAE
jgi:hypothetical protein